MVKANEEQALVPDNAKIIKNKIGTAPGLLFDNNKYFFILPGVPIEMKTMTENFIIPLLKKKNKKFIKKRVLHFSGIPESTLFEKLGDIEKLEKLAKIAFLPHFGIVDIRLTASGLNERLCIKNIERVEKVIREKVGSNIWGTDEETLEEVIINKLIERGKTLSIVEYGTRGEITAKLTRHQNPEKYFVQSSIISSLNLCERLLGKSDPKVKPVEMVSEKTAKYLAANIKEKTNADLGLAIVHDNQLETTSFIALSDSRQTCCWSSAFPHKTNVAIKRVVIDALHNFYHYILNKNLLD